MSSITTAVPVTTGAAVSLSRRWAGYLLVAATLFLIWWGGQVKSHEAGLSVPDWPLSYGTWFPPLVGNVYWEHLHRVIAASVGFVTILIAVWTARTESRLWVVKLAWVCLAAVCVQGLLGGANVHTLLFLPVTFAHSTLAQIVLCMMAWWSYSVSRECLDGPARVVPDLGAAAGRSRRAALVALIAVFVQLLLGVTVRHTESGLAVPFFPVSPAGHWVPEFVDGSVVIHMLHRGFALVVTVAVLRAAWIAVRELAHVGGHALLLTGMLGVQVMLGAGVIWTGKAPTLTSFHVVTGAALLMLTWLLVLRCRRAEQWAADPHPGTTPQVVTRGAR